MLRPAEDILEDKYGMIYATLLFLSLGFMTRSLFTAASSSLEGKRNTAQLPYKAPLVCDILLQIVTGSALLLSLVLKVHGTNSTSEPLLLGYISFLELINMWTSRQARNSLRKAVHRHIVGLILLSTLASIAIVILPFLIISHNVPLTPLRLATSLLLVACVVVIAFTPRGVIIDNYANEYNYSKAHSIRSREFSLPTPSPEEYCSPFAYCVSYGCLTKLIFCGYHRKLTIEDLPPLSHYYEPLIWLTRVLETR